MNKQTKQQPIPNPQFPKKAKYWAIKIHLHFTELSESVRKREREEEEREREACDGGILSSLKHQMIVAD